MKQPPSAVRSAGCGLLWKRGFAVDELQPLEQDKPRSVLGRETERLMSEVHGSKVGTDARADFNATAYFLNKFSNAARASFGRRLAGVDVSFSRVTRIS